MSEQVKQTFLEKLELIYPGQFIVEKASGRFHSDAAIFPAKNKHFGSIKISNGLDRWEDEDDYDEIKFDDDNYCECGGDFQDYCEDISLDFEIPGASYFLTPTMIFEYLEEIFDDRIVVYWTLKPWRKKDNGLYKREVFEDLLNKGKIPVAKHYKLCLWSGNYPLPSSKG